MQVTQLMSNPVVTVAMDDPISSIKRIFEQTRFHHLLVVENSKLVGVISDRDLLKVLSPKIDTPAATTGDLAVLDRKAHQIMSRELITLGDDASVNDAVKVFNQHSISCIPITNDNKKPVGILSWRDIMKVIAEKN